MVGLCHVALIDLVSKAFVPRNTGSPCPFQKIDQRINAQLGDVAQQ